MMTLIIVYSISVSNQFTLKIKSYCRSRDADRPTMTSHRRSWHAWHPRIDAPPIANRERARPAANFPAMAMPTQATKIDLPVQGLRRLRTGPPPRHTPGPPQSAEKWN